MLVHVSPYNQRYFADAVTPVGTSQTIIVPVVFCIKRYRRGGMHVGFPRGYKPRSGLEYEWKGKNKKCSWAEKAKGQFDLLEAVGQEARETKAIENFLCSEREPGRI
jgi:hypothetical protein